VTTLGVEKRDRSSGEFMAVKKPRKAKKAAQKFKGVRIKEKPATQYKTKRAQRARRPQASGAGEAGRRGRERAKLEYKLAHCRYHPILNDPRR
jgi:hypothetical protein